MATAGSYGVGDASLLRWVGEQEAAQAISVAWPPRQTRTLPDPAPSVTMIWLWNTVRPMVSTATISVTP